MKESSELAYWEEQYWREGVLLNSWFKYFHTGHFDIPERFYREKNLLDIGCGPRGSLEWAVEAALRVGVDPLALEYTAFGVGSHQMSYVAARAEQLPFRAGSFDVVFAFNSLDHVDDLKRSISEIKRVVAPEGLFLLIADVHQLATEREPSAFSWEIVDEFEPELELLTGRHWEKSSGGMYASAAAAVPYDHSDVQGRYGVISASFRKPASPLPPLVRLWRRTLRKAQVLVPKARGMIRRQSRAVVAQATSRVLGFLLSRRR